MKNNFFIGLLFFTLIILKDNLAPDSSKFFLLRRIRKVENPEGISIRSPFGILIGRQKSYFMPLIERVNKVGAMIVGLKKEGGEVEYVKVISFLEKKSPYVLYIPNDYVVVEVERDKKVVTSFYTLDNFLQIWDGYQYWTQDLLARSGVIVPKSFNVGVRHGSAHRSISPSGGYYVMPFSIYGRDSYAMMIFSLDKYDTQRLLRADKLGFEIAGYISRGRGSFEVLLEFWAGTQLLLQDRLSKVGEDSEWKSFDFSLNLLKTDKEELEIRFRILPIREVSITGNLVITPLIIKF